MTTYFVRKSGNDNNGGTSPSVRSTGSDGVTNALNSDLTSVTGAWSADDIGHGIKIGSAYRIITAVASPTTLTYSGASLGTAASVTWTIGGAWLTISKALGASGISSGDTVYVGAGVYREQVVVNMISAAAETFVIGDVAGAHTGDTPGEVRITNHLTDDVTAPTNQSVLDLNGRDFLTFRYIYFHAQYTDALASTVYVIDGFTTRGASNIVFRDCSFLIASMEPTNQANIFGARDAVAPTGFDWIIDRCNIVSLAVGFVFQIQAEVSGANLDVDLLIQNCTIQAPMSERVLYFDGGDDGSFAAGGAVFINNTVFSLAKSVFTVNSTTTYPVLVYNNILINSIPWGDYLIYATSAGQIIENYNFLVGNPMLNNVTPGSNSKDGGSYAFLINFGQETQIGKRTRPWGTPFEGSPMLGFGNHASAPSVDILNRPRPAGGMSTGSAVGAYELHDTGTREDSVYDSPPSSMKIIGQGDHDFEVPVNPVSTNITVVVRYDTNHGTANKPQVQLLANEVIGVDAETLTMTDGVDTWEMLSFSNFTPTDYGIVILRCISRSATGNGIAYFDSITA